MKNAVEKKAVTNFINICNWYFNTVQYPFLSDFSYGELLLQTADGQEFFFVDLLENETFKFLCSNLNIRGINPQNVLILLADKKNDKKLIVDYPICPNCLKMQKHFNTNEPGTERLVEYATWQFFEELSESDKMIRLTSIIKSLI